MNVTMSSSPGFGGTSAARTAPPPPPPPQDSKTSQAGAGSISEVVSSLDSDGDGGLSYGEVSDSFLENLINSENWSEVDGDGDGLLSADELETHRAATTPGGEGDMPPPPPPQGGGGMGGPGGGGMGGPGGGSGGMSESESIVLSLIEDAAAMNGTASDSSSAYAEELYATMQEMLIAAG
ncbi:hypothetical protein [Rhodovulum marinum]|uniref:EF hand domain-containing protein n=1 Tax=Rhodovulum marinum TaxID=320662 RepID=A0A4R2Q676_9RHOB|nr:hypothetical protein [Rhodovulum marinum]TCP43999.1 hypothetical protein EV662_10184 [Rhodovulum marinum]